MMKNHKFSLYYLLVALVGLFGFFVCMVTMPKHAFFLFINKHHCLTADYFYKYITHLGDGLFYLFIIILIGLFISYRNAFIALIAWGVSAGIVQFAKHIIFPDAFRPVRYFAGQLELNLVEGVETHCCNSFPSGHTATAFSLFMILSFIVNKPIWNIVFSFIAISVAISRMYLCQHFLEDVFFGGLIGYVTSFLIIYSSGLSKFKTIDAVHFNIFKK